MAADRFLAEFGNLTFESMIEQECQIKAKKNLAGYDEIVEEEEEEEDEEQEEEDEILPPWHNVPLPPRPSSALPVLMVSSPKAPPAAALPARPSEPALPPRAPAAALPRPSSAFPAEHASPAEPAGTPSGRGSSSSIAPRRTDLSPEEDAEEEKRKAHALHIYRQSEEHVRRAVQADREHLGDSRVSAVAYSVSESTLAKEGDIHWYDRGPRGEDAPEFWRGQKRRASGRYSTRGGDPVKNAWHAEKARAKCKGKDGSKGSKGSKGKAKGKAKGSKDKG